MWPYTTPYFQGKERKKIKSSIKIKPVMNVWWICYIEMHGCNLQVKGKEGNAQIMA
jgi:hypothetical protein